MIWISNAENGGEPVVLDHRANGRPIVEVLDDVIDILAETVDVRPKVLL